MAVLVLIGLSGCGTMIGDDCLTSDWQVTGFEDGFKGYGFGSLGGHRKTSTKHGIKRDLQAYRFGTEEGLQEFC